MATTRRDRRQHDRNQRTGVLLGVAAVLIGALLVYQVFLKSDDGPATASAPAASSAAAAGSGASGTTTTTVPQEPTLPNGSFEELSLRDPFEPVGTFTPVTTPTTSTTTTPSGSIPTTPTTSPAQNPSGAVEIELLDVTNVNGTLTARVAVGGSQYTVTAGQQFADNYRLVQFTSDTCADFTHGDATFPLCAGQQSNK
ncbi:MAG: hypothetical protein ACXVK4_17990 [Acidimicrobiia bacterium]